MLSELTKHGAVLSIVLASHDSKVLRCNICLPTSIIIVLPVSALPGLRLRQQCLPRPVHGFQTQCSGYAPYVLDIMAVSYAVAHRNLLANGSTRFAQSTLYTAVVAEYQGFLGRHGIISPSQ